MENQLAKKKKEIEKTNTLNETGTVAKIIN